MCQSFFVREYTHALRLLDKRGSWYFIAATVFIIGACLGIGIAGALYNMQPIDLFVSLLATGLLTGLSSIAYVIIVSIGACLAKQRHPVVLI